MVVQFNFKNNLGCQLEYSQQLNQLKQCYRLMAEARKNGISITILIGSRNHNKNLHLIKFVYETR